MILYVLMMDYEAQLKSCREEAEKAVQRWLPAASARPVRLHQAMRYSVESGGKRLRPVFLLATHALYPSRGNPAPAAAAL